VLELTGTRTELDLANRLSVYGYVEEHTMRDGHVWCIGSAREREKAGDEGASHSSRGQRASSQKMGRKDGMPAKAGRSRVSRAEPGSALGSSRAFGLLPRGRNGCAGLFTPASSPPLTQKHASNWPVARTHGERGAQIRHSRYIRPLKPDETRVRQMSCGPRCGTC
jgi:hypothetical protein